MFLGGASGRAAHEPACVGLHSNLIFALDLTPGAGAEAWEERRRWNERHAAPLAATSRPHANRPDPERRLRIGYVSADFRRHSAAYGDVDLVLDPVPQSGGITILEGLWMGVPAVTLLGESIVGRIAGSLLHATGLPDLVASTPEAYVETAVRLTADLPRLAARRAALREQLASSPVCRPRLFTAAVEGAYQAMWRRSCAGMGSPG